MSLVLILPHVNWTVSLKFLNEIFLIVDKNDVCIKIRVRQCNTQLSLKILSTHAVI